MAEQGMAGMVRLAMTDGVFVSRVRDLLMRLSGGGERRWELLRGLDGPFRRGVQV